FSEHRTNILMDRASVPSSMGLQAATRANVGEASGKGFEVAVDYNQYFSNGFWMTGRGNFTYATSEYKVYEEAN
ncbi:TonB-dependent receptor, partial [Klebsiella oxytoca]